MGWGGDEGGGAICMSVILRIPPPLNPPTKKISQTMLTTTDTHTQITFLNGMHPFTRPCHFSVQVKRAQGRGQTKVGRGVHVGGEERRGI